MKRWLRYAGIAVLVLGFAFCVLFEASSHVVRGWLRGEAFYDGRPTSYWRLQCDEWLERFDDVDSIKQCTWLIPFELPGDTGVRRFGIDEDLKLEGSSMRMPAETYWKRVSDFFRSKEGLERERRYDFAPQILRATPDTQPVLEQLAAEEKYRLLTSLALRRVQRFRKVQAAEEAVAKEGKK